MLALCSCHPQEKPWDPAVRQAVHMGAQVDRAPWHPDMPQYYCAYDVQLCISCFWTATLTVALHQARGDFCQPSLAEHLLTRKAIRNTWLILEHGDFSPFSFVESHYVEQNRCMFTMCMV